VNASFGLALLAKTNRELVGIAFGHKYFGDCFLLLSVSKSDLWARVVFGYAVLAAELSAAVRALERHKYFLSAFLTVHV
jgi:hypothetical protein